MRHSRTSNNQTELLSIVQSIQRHLESNRKQQNRITPAIARTFSMKIDNSIRKNGSSAISSNSIRTKIDYIARMLMGVSSANLMNLSVSDKGGLLAKATLLKGNHVRRKIGCFYDLSEPFQRYFCSCLISKPHDRE